MNLPYSFRVEGVSSAITGSKSPLSGLFNLIGSPSGGGMFDEFPLPINPQEISQDEVFSIVVTPTQKGLIAEHNGVVFKDLVISGTTGQRPNNTHSGYELFQQLRNYFRSYAEVKKSPDQKFTQLVFLNRKDNENLIVEPQKFSMQRSKEAPFLYNYTIVLKVLGSRRPFFGEGILGDFFNKIDNIIQVATDLIYGVRNVIEASKNFIKTFERELVETFVEPIEAVNLALRSAQGLPLSLFDVPSSVKNQFSDRTIKAFLDEAKTLKKNGNIALSGVTLPINTAREASANKFRALDVIPISVMAILPVSFLTTKEKELLNSAIQDSLKKPRSFYQNLLTASTTIGDNAAEKFGFGNDDYNEFIGRTRVFSDDEVDDPNHFTAEKLDIMKAFMDSQAALRLILSTDDFFKGNLIDYVQDVINNYDQNIQVATPNSVDEIILSDNTTLEQIAMEYLGSAERWIDIAIVNNLVSPYIANTSTNIRVKQPGDKLLIPKLAVPELSNIPKTKPIKISEDLTETERNLGVDVKVKLNDGTFDFIMNSNNDFELVASGDNAGQAVIIRLGLEKGSLKYHPEIGVGLRIGEKIRQGVDVRDDIVNSILSDSRFINIKNLNFTTQGGTISISLDLVVKHLLTPVPLTLKV